VAGKWTTVAPGIRVRDHESRRHGVRFDRYFTLRFSVEGRQVEEALGWASEGWSLNKAQEELGKLREAKRTGKGASTLRERAQAERETERKQTELDRQRERGEKIVADLWDRYSKEIIAVENKPRTAAEKTRLWERRIKAALGHLKVRAVTDEDAGAVVHGPLRLDAAGRAIGGKAEAGNVYRLLHHLFSKALGWGLRPKELGNPLETITEPKVARRERLLTAGEVGALIRALDAPMVGETEGRQTGRPPKQTEDPQMIAIIRASILTGARISELLNLRWEHISRDDMEFRLPDTKTGFSRRPLSPATLAVLDSMERMPGVPFVFRSAKNPTNRLSYSGVEKAFRRITARAGVKGCTLHTIRHWVATMTANSVSNPRVGMAITGHRSHAAYMNYVHGDKEQARALADQLAKLAQGLGAAEPNVIELPKTATG